MRKLLLSAFYFLFSASFASAAGGQLDNPLGCGDFKACLDKIMPYFLAIAVPIASIMIIYGGFQMMTAAGDPQKFTAGKKTLLYAAIGLGVVLSAEGIVAMIQKILQ